MEEEMQAVTQRGAESPERNVKLYRVEQAADLLGITVKALRHMTSRRTIPIVRLGPRTIRYSLVDLQAWIDKHKVRALS